MTYYLRPARQEDLSQVAEVDRSCFPTMSPATNYQTEFLNPLAHYIVIGGAELIPGFAGLWLLAGEAHLINIAVREAHRGEGLGEFLLIGIIQLAQSLKASMLTLEVRVSNFVAQRLYVKYGLTERGRRRGYYLDNREDAIIMTLDDPSSSVYEATLRPLRDVYEDKWLRDTALPLTD